MMKKINNRIVKLIAFFVIFTLLSICSSFTLAAELDDYFNQTGGEGFYATVVTYTTTDSTNKNVEVKKICFTMPQNLGQDVFVDSSQQCLLYKGKEQVKFNVTFSSGSFTRTFKDPPLSTNNDDNRANLLLNDLVVKKDESGKECVYYQGDKVDTLENFKSNLTVSVNVSEPIQTTYTPTLTTWKEKHQKGKFFLLVWLDWIKDKALSILSNIFTDLLLAIADAFRSLINSIFDEDVTLGKVIYNDVDKLKINFWEMSDKTSIGGMLKPLVSYWFGKFQGIVMMVYVCILLYVGIKILITSTAGSLEKAKELLSSWLLGLILLVFFPTCMKYIVTLNEKMVQLVQETSDKITVNPDKIDALDKIRNMADTYSNIPLCVIYIIMLGQLMVLLVVYYKRAFTIAYLIVIFPIVQGYYIYEKVSKR